MNKFIVDMYLDNKLVRQIEVWATNRYSAQSKAEEMNGYNKYDSFKISGVSFSIGVQVNV